MIEKGQIQAILLHGGTVNRHPNLAISSAADLFAASLECLTKE